MPIISRVGHRSFGSLMAFGQTCLILGVGAATKTYPYLLDAGDNATRVIGLEIWLSAFA